VYIVGKEFSAYIYGCVLKLKEKRKIIICDLCEELFGITDEWYEKIIQASDHIVCASKKLSEKVFQFNKHTSVIEDAIESDLRLNCAYMNDHKLKVLYLGYGGGTRLLDPIRPIVRSLNMDLIEIHEWESATIKWEPQKWIQDCLQCDIAIIPHDIINQPCKSANRLTQLWALGFPVIVSPLPSYINLIQYNSAYIAETLQDWEQGLINFKNWKTRYDYGQAGKNIAKEFTIDKIAEKWINLTRELLCKK
jgi:glycosyltransferase involved in cell wall biosynthesis